jgi:hypothetical protein
MPNLNDIFPSRFLKAHELQGGSPTVTIARVELEVMGRTRERKAVAYFVGKKKGLLLNKTNAQAIAKIAGSEATEQWIGVRVRLMATTDTFGKDVFPVVRVQPVPAAGSGRVA